MPFAQIDTCPEKSVGAAKILPASEGFDEGKVLLEVATILFGTAVELIVFLDSMDLFISLYTQKHAGDPYIPPIVETIRFVYETNGIDEAFWLPGSPNLADPRKKTDNPLIQPIHKIFVVVSLPLTYGGLNLDNAIAHWVEFVFVEKKMKRES